jgi:hypothetical protein
MWVQTLVREFDYLYGAVSPKDGTCVCLIMPALNTNTSRFFLDTLAKKCRRQFVLLFVDGAGAQPAPTHSTGAPSSVLSTPGPKLARELKFMLRCSLAACQNDEILLEPIPGVRYVTLHIGEEYCYEENVKSPFFSCQRIFRQCS